MGNVHVEIWSDTPGARAKQDLQGAGQGDEENGTLRNTDASTTGSPVKRSTLDRLCTRGRAARRLDQLQQRTCRAAADARRHVGRQIPTAIHAAASMMRQ